MPTIGDFRKRHNEVLDLFDVTVCSSEEHTKFTSLTQKVRDAIMIEYDLGSYEEVDSLPDSTELGAESKNAFKRLEIFLNNRNNLQEQQS